MGTKCHRSQNRKTPKNIHPSGEPETSIGQIRQALVLSKLANEGLRYLSTAAPLNAPATLKRREDHTSDLKGFGVRLALRMNASDS